MQTMPTLPKTERRESIERMEENKISLSGFIDLPSMQIISLGLGALCVVFSCVYPGACTRVRLELSAWSRVRPELSAGSRSA